MTDSPQKSTEASRSPVDRREKFWQHPLLTGVGGFLLGFLACIFWQMIFSNHFHFQSQSKVTQGPHGFLPPGFPPSAFPQDGQDDSAGDDLPSDDAGQNGADPHDPAAQMRRLQQQMMNQMFRQQLDDSADDDSATASDMGGGISAPDFVRHEDDKYVYLELAVEGLNTKNLSVEVKDGVVMLNGSLDQKTDAGSEIHQSFQRQFSAPAGVNANKVEVEQHNKKLVLKFPKN